MADSSGEAGPQDLFRQVLNRKETLVDLEGFLASMLRAFGGPDRVAEEYVRVYYAAKKSPMVQSRILLMIQQLIHATQVHSLKGRLDLSALDEADLARLKAEYMDRMINAGLQEARAPVAPGRDDGTEPGWTVDGGAEADSGDPAAP